MWWTTRRFPGILCVVKDVTESTVPHSVDAVARIGTLNASRVTP